MRIPVTVARPLALLGLCVPLRAQASFGLAFGPDDFVAVPASASLNSIAGAITVEAWVRLTGTTSRPTVVRRNISSPFGAPQIYILRVDDVFATTMELAFYVVNDAVFATVPLSLGTWHHIAGTLSGTETRIYWDGQLVGTGAHSGGIPTSGAPLRIGIGETFEPWLGEVDEVRLWNLARTPAEVQSFMSSPLAGSEPGLVGYWKFDEGAGQAASDATSAGNHGVLGGSNVPDPNDPTWIVSTAPVGLSLLSLSQTFGPFYATSTVLLHGTGFLPSPSTSVTVGGQAVPFALLPPLEILATIPPGPVGPADVTVTTSQGSVTLADGWIWADHLHATSTAISASKGGVAPLFLFAEPANALRLYVVLASGSGTDPGCPIPGSPLLLPLNCDLWTSLAILGANSPVFPGFFGILGWQGTGNAALDLTSVPVPPSAVGLELSFAYAVVHPLGTVELVSNPVAVSIAP